MSSKNLNVNYCFLYHAISTHIFMRVSGYDKVTHMEAFAMYHFITGKRINMSLLILRHMRTMRGREKARLPYGNIVTKILLHFRVPLEGEVHHALQPLDKLGKGTLSRMGFKKHKILGTWISRDEDLNRVEQEDEKEGEEQDEIGPEINQAPSIAPTYVSFSISLEDIMMKLRSIEHDIKRRQKRLERKLVKKGLISDEDVSPPTSQ
ncbi:hypothetical protein CFOL_v3_16247 [Cephalotus follicularis]|uniref:Uncharacterized protein n=1 Tax=Cephalotus follicularis TaxID=3775 RepID=A0A1Q3BY10_CEPFO|nr:hypothetical protein CFOL_v3_16247 [Cephalotus follicularis]